VCATHKTPPRTHTHVCVCDVAIEKDERGEARVRQSVRGSSRSLPRRKVSVAAASVFMQRQSLRDGKMSVCGMACAGGVYSTKNRGVESGRRDIYSHCDNKTTTHS